MKVVVIGCGKIGKSIIEHTVQEGHEVVVVDNNADNIELMINQFDVMGICGNGASYDILKDAGVDKQTLVIAATSSDETNILSCLVSKKLGAKYTIARVRSIEYLNQINFIKNDLGINLTINPEYEAAKEITKILNFPEAISVDSFAKSHVDLVELFIPKNSPLANKSLIDIYMEYQIKVLICAVQRGEEVFIPTGRFVLQEEDRIYITAASKNSLRSFLTKSSLLESKIKTVLLIGGSKIAVYLGKELLKNKYQVKIIEKKLERCEELSELLPGATIIHGDGSDQRILEEEGLNDSDALICLTNIDEENIIISLYAHKQNVRKIVTKINKQSLVGLMEKISLSSVISLKDITASIIVTYLRGVSNTRGSNVLTLHKLVNNKVEALEFLAKEDKRLINIPFKDLRLKANVLIVGIIRDGKVIIPNGDDVIKVNDNVIVVTTKQFLDDLSDILE